MITEQKVIDELRNMPEEQKESLATHAAARGVDIETQLVPFLTKVLRGCEVVAGPLVRNRRFLDGLDGKEWQD